MFHKEVRREGYTAWCSYGHAFSVKGIAIHIGMMRKKARDGV